MLAKQTDWNTFYTLVNRLTGVDFELYKQDQLQRRILNAISTQKFGSFEQFSNWIKSDPANLEWFLDRMAINVSELFRNPDRWSVLSEVVIPDLLTRSRKLKCWSAGCSYGAEAHTLATILHHDFKGGHTIIGTDIDQAALRQARASEFNTADTRGIPEKYKDYYIQKGQLWTVKPEIKAGMTFTTQNLLADRFDRGFDLIICRNVVIYFTDEAKDKLYARFTEALKPGGYLFVGGTERVFRANELGLSNPQPFFYQKPVLGDKTWLNAS